MKSAIKSFQTRKLLGERDVAIDSSSKITILIADI
jgi:hypothetical protein